MNEPRRYHTISLYIRQLDLWCL